MTHRIPVQAYDLNKIKSLRRNLFDQAFFGYLGMRLQGAGLEHLTVAIRRQIRGVKYQTIYDSIMHLGGQIMTEELAKDTAWRLAGNVPKLRNGDAVLPWTYQSEPEWMPVHILSMRATHNYKREPAGEFVLKILAGSACLMTLVKMWTPRFCAMLARRMGFSSRRGDLPYYDMLELVNLRARILVTSEKCTHGRPDFEKIECGSAALDWNKNIIHHRRRVVDGKLWPCPRRYTHQCYQCHVGYVDCIAGCHPHTAYQDTHATVPSAPAAHP